MSFPQIAISRQEFMKRLKRSIPKNIPVVRLPFVYTSMEGACVTQVQQIRNFSKGATA